MSGKFLSAEELWQGIKPPDMGLPQRGIKDYAPDGSWMQEKHLESFLKDRQAILREERIVKLDTLREGIWCPEKQKVEVKRRGKFISHFSHSEDQKDYLYPEEALFLIDQGNLEIQYEGMPMTIQRAYATLLSKEVPLEHYQVYSHLCRLGYIIMRHRKPTVITNYERTLGLHRFNKKSRKERRRKGKNDNGNTDETVEKRMKLEDPSDVTAVLPSASDSDVDSKTVDSTEVVDKKNETSQDIDNSENVHTDKDLSNMADDIKHDEWMVRQHHFAFMTDDPSDDMDQDEVMDEVNDLPPQEFHVPYSNWDFNEISFPSISGKSSTLMVEKPEDDTLPKNISLSKDQYEFNVTSLRNQRPPKNYEDTLEFSHGSVGLKATVSEASNWGEYKAGCEALMEECDTAFTPVAHLWHGDDVTPLIRPEEATSTGVVLKKLKVNENVHLSWPKSELGSATSTDLKITYDVYRPSNKFSKTDPGLPLVRIAISKFTERPPNLGDTMSLMKQCTDGVPLHWAVVDHGNISFFSFHDVDIPTDITLG